MKTTLRYRYPGSLPFQDTSLDQHLFFGREREAWSLLHTVLAENLVVLFAKSGIGKTSLLNARLLQTLRDREFFPVMIKFNDPEITPLQAVYEGIANTVKRYGVECQNAEPKNTFWKYFTTAEFWSSGEFWRSKDILLTPVLILDQFEEFFMLHTQETRAMLTTQLAELMKGRFSNEFRKSLTSEETSPNTVPPPHVKVIISIREDFLGYLENLSQEIPEIFRNRLRLLPLQREQAKQAIIEPARLEDKLLDTPSFDYAPEVVEAMLDFLGKQRKMDEFIVADEIEPFQLQLLCQHLENMVLEKSKKEGQKIIVQKDDLGSEASMQNVLEDFYDNQIEQLGSEFHQQRVRLLCEEGLISLDNRRLSLEEEEIKRRFRVEKFLLTELVNRRLLRAESRVGSIYYELSHDTLLEPIRNSRKKRRAINERFMLSEAHYNLGNLQFRQGEYDSAIENYTQAIQLNPIKSNLDAIYNSLGNAFSNRGNIEEAIENYKKAVQLNPNYAKAYNNLAKTFGIQGKLDEEIETYRKAIQSDPNFVYAYINLGTMLLIQNKYDEAYNIIDKAYQLTPEDFSVKTGFAVINLFTRHFNKAFSLANEVLGERTLFSTSMSFILISSLLCQGEFSEAFGKLDAFIGYYTSLSDSVYSEQAKRWKSYEPFISQNAMLTESEKTYILKLIDLLASPKSEIDKKLEEFRTLWSRESE